MREKEKAVCFLRYIDHADACTVAFPLASITTLCVSTVVPVHTAIVTFSPWLPISSILVLAVPIPSYVAVGSMDLILWPETGTAFATSPSTAMPLDSTGAEYHRAKIELS